MRILTFFALTLTLTFSFSQQISDNRIKLFKTYDSSVTLNRLSTSSFFLSELGLDSRNEFRVTRTETDKYGYTHVRHQQYLTNYKVEFGELTTHSERGNLKSLNAIAFYIEKTINPPSVTESVALENAKNYIGSIKLLTKDDAQAEILGYEGFNTELVILPIIKGVTNEVTLAYKFDLYSMEPVHRAYVYIDAYTGQAIFEDLISHHVDVDATGESLYDGTVGFTADQDGGIYSLSQSTSGGGIVTYELNGSTNYSDRTSITSTSSHFDGETTTGVQAHWATEQTYDYYFNEHSRNSYDNNGAQLISYVGYYNNYVNAFWNGSVMTYGDGDGHYRGPLVPLDIVGHEITHGVTSRSSNLIYQKESGALNESFSDIFGEAVESYAKGSRDWFTGREMGLNGYNGAFRSMSNPNAYGDPDTYQGDYWINTDCSPSSGNDYCGVHTNSGVQNFWFYLLTEGGSGVNDNGDSYTVSGIGIEKAEQIAYRNLTVYLSRYSDYEDARQGAIQSAIDLHGMDSQEMISVVNAWYAVGLGLEYGAECTESLVSSSLNIEFEEAEFMAGLDFTEGNPFETNDSSCSLELINEDAGQPWARYRLSIDLNKNEVEAGDEVYFTVDGKNGGGNARIEIVEDNTPNIALFSHDFSDEWSTTSTTFTVPEGLSTIDVWLYSNYNQNTIGNAFYDNLEIVNLSNIQAFVTTWRIDGDNTLDFYHNTGYNYNFNIDWGDGTIEQNVGSGSLSHTYEASGQYQISISGDYPAIVFGNSYDRNRLLSVDDWGDIEWQTMDSAFEDCQNVQILATDAPILTNVTSMYQMFENADKVNDDFSGWDFSSVTNMGRMFYDADGFNQNISDWVLGNSVSLYQMFYAANAFDQDLGDLIISGVNNLYDVFSYSGLSLENYDDTLIGWAAQENIPNDLNLRAYNISYCEGAEARQKLISEHGWSIVDNGVTCPITIPFVTTWKTDNSGYSADNQIRFPVSFPAEITIDWGDGTSNTGVTETITHAYSQSGTYQISVTGIYPVLQLGSYSSYSDRNKLLSVDQWGDSKWSSMSGAFQYCENVQILATDVPDLNNVVSLDNMFRNTGVMNEDISTWDFSNITNFSSMFYEADSFNQDISVWSFGNEANLAYMFNNADAFNQDLGDLPLSKITSMNNTFSYSGLSQENYDNMLMAWSDQDNIPTGLSLSANGITYCSGQTARQKMITDHNWYISDGGLACPSTIPFVTTWKTDNQGNSENNQITLPISSPAEVTIDWGDGTTDSGVKSNITHTYTQAGSYQISISGIYPKINFGNSSDRNKLISVDQWGDSKWTTMSNAFVSCENVQVLATDIPDLSNASSLHEMFRNADNMNEDISTWDFTSITDFSEMFYDADAFNQSIVDWQLGSSVSMSSMFNQADSFDQDLGGLNLSKISNLNNMFSYSGISQGNYDNTLIGWAAQENIPSYIYFYAYNITYCNGEEARQQLIDEHNWTIYDGGLACPSTTAFITSWKTDNSGASGDNQIIYPIDGLSEVTIDWGDGTTDTNVKKTITHTYTEVGTYQVSVTGVYPTLSFGNSNFGDQNKLVSIDQWGDSKWISMDSAFENCQNVQLLATDAPDLGNTTTLADMFQNADSMNTDISDWDFSNITNFSEMFFDADSFNQDISSWNFRDEVSLYRMFYNADSFNQSLGGIAVSKITNLSSIFSFSGMSTENYDNTLIGWAVQEGVRTYVSLGATNITYCEGAEARQKLIDDFNWYISDAGLACASTLAFITSWKTDNPGSSSDSQVTIPIESPANVRIDWGDGSFNNNVSETITHTYAEVGTYQISITGTYPRINFGSSYSSGDKNKLVSIDQWGDSKWSTMDSAFENCQNVELLATDIPDLSVATSLRDMFQNADAINTDISNWDFSNITDFSEMFYEADAFNQNISTWNFGESANLSNMFYYADAFDQDLGDLPISKVSSLYNTFSNSGLSTENYDKTLIGWADQENVPSNLSFRSYNITYCDGVGARQKLINDYGWYVYDGGEAEGCGADDFITTWYLNNTGRTNFELTIPTHPDEVYDYTIDWGDGTIDYGVTGNIAHTYSAGVYEVRIRGQFPRMYFEGREDNNVISYDINQWGNNTWTSFEGAFFGSDLKDIKAIDVPDLSRVTSMRSAFSANPYMTNSTQSLSTWDVSTITNMRSMFGINNLFGLESLDSWDVSNVTDMSGMFALTGFNGTISSWNVSKVTNLGSMFYSSSFNQDISSWDVSSVESMAQLFDDSALSDSNYDAILIGWSQLPSLQNNVTLDAPQNYYCSATEERQYIIDTYGWTINDLGPEAEPPAAVCKDITVYLDEEGSASITVLDIDDDSTDNCGIASMSVSPSSFDTDDIGVNQVEFTVTDVNGNVSSCTANVEVKEQPRPFVTTWKTDNSGTSEDNQITIPTYPGETYDYIVDWGDGTTSENVTGDITHTYATSGTYTVSISGDFPRIYFDDGGDGDKLVTVAQWGDIEWSSMESSFAGAHNLDVIANDTPDLSNVYSMRRMFYYTNNLVGSSSFNSWDVGNVEDFSLMFFQSQHFNQEIGNWNVGNATVMDNMFGWAHSFNTDIGSWDVSQVENMSRMFSYASEFNQDIGAWDTSNVLDMNNMFNAARDFNQDIGDWNVSNVNDMGGMFFSAESLNQNFGEWSISNVTDMAFMFSNSALSNENYDKTLIGWSQLSSLESGVRLDAPENQYCEAKEARQLIIDTYGWTINDAGEAEGCDEPVACTDYLPNEDLAIVLPSGGLSAGADEVIGTDVNTNGSDCAIVVVNDDSGQPWGRYAIPIVLSDYGIEVGDRLYISVDGNDGTGNARFEINQDNGPNTALGSANFDSEWSTYETTVTVPSGISSIDLWFHSNYTLDTPGAAHYDNLVVINLDDVGSNIAPIANAGIDQAVIDTNADDIEDVILDGTNSADVDGTIVSYSWSENGTEIATGAAPTISLSIGIHSLVLTVTDNEGATDDDTVEITVSEPLANQLPVSNAGVDQTVVDVDGNGSEDVILDGSGSTDSDGTIASYSWAENGTEIATGVSPTVTLSIGGHTLVLTVTDDEGATDSDTVIITVNEDIVPVECPDYLPNEDLAIVLPSGGLSAGADAVEGTDTNTNGSPCAIEVVNDDAGQPWGRYAIPIVLSDYGIQEGDRLFISVDGNDGTGNARFEINQDNRPNTALGSANFDSEWSTYETTVTVPSGISSIDLWFHSNYTLSTPGTAYYDNLVVINLDNTPSCAISNIEVTNISECNSQGTLDPSDDTFTADVTITFENVPISGFLQITGDVTTEVQVSELSGTSYTFTAAGPFMADGGPISLTASFTDGIGCTYTNSNSGTAPSQCSSDPTAFITAWKTDNPGASEDNQITIPTHPDETYNYTVNWGDGNISENVTGDALHTYEEPGSYVVSITGVFPRIYFNNEYIDKDIDKITGILQWGTIEWTSFEYSFWGCENLQLLAEDVPDLSQVTSLSQMFSACYQFVGNDSMDNWDVSTINDMSNMFSLTLFDGNLGNWDVSNVTNMFGLFAQCFFNGDIGTWDVSNVTNMAFMFNGNSFFNKSIGNWDTSSVRRMESMFEDAVAFNQGIGDWNVSNVLNMDFMLAYTQSFNQSLGNWDVSNVESMEGILNEDDFRPQALSDENYNSTLIGWGQLPSLQSGVQLDAPGNQYCEAKEARQLIIDTYGWVINDAGEAEGCDEPIACTDYLPNENEEMVLPTGSLTAGADVVVGTDINVNGSACAIEVTNNDSDQPWGRYFISITLDEYGISPGDRLRIGVDGNDGTGNARFEINQNNTPNTALGASNFNGDWNRYETTIVVPSGITTIDLWFHSNYTLNTPGTAYYDNLEVINLDSSVSGLQANLNNMFVSPNPANVTSSVSFEKAEEVDEILIFDMGGRMIQRYDAEEIKRGDHYEMNVYQIPVGTYIVRSRSDSGVEFSKQMVIKR